MMTAGYDFYLVQQHNMAWDDSMEYMNGRGYGRVACLCCMCYFYENQQWL